MKTMIGDRRLVVSLSFIQPEDENIIMASSPEALMEAKRHSPDGHVDQDLVDRITGVTVTAIAHIGVLDDAEKPEAFVSLSKEELAKHIVACRAVFESMDGAAEVADRRWSRYRKRKVEEANDETPR